MRQFLRNKYLIAMLVLAGMFATMADTCDNHDANVRSQDQQTQEQTLRRLSAELPVPTVDYAPTRRTVIDWITRWDQPDKVSFIYLLADNGQQLGYFVMRGLPVSYCVGLTAPEQQVDTPGDGSSERNAIVSAPGLDGVYYSGGDCNHYYGFDAGTGAYLEFGGGVRFVAADQPLPIDVPPLGITKIEDVNSPGFKVHQPEPETAAQVGGK